MQIKPFTLITGASEGLGKAMAIECAKQNMNLALIALPGSELQALATFIKKNFDVQVQSLGVDLTQENACTLILDWIGINKISVNILLNNAGIGSTGPFEHFSTSFYKKQIQLNVLAVAELTSLLLPILRLNKQSYIMNTASLAGFFSIPYKDVYAATKAFVISFSKALSLELENNHVYVSVLCPGGMNSNLLAYSKNNNHGWLAKKTIMEPEDVASIAIKEMLEKKKVIIPGYASKLLYLLDKVIPNFIKQFIIHYSFKKEYQLSHQVKRQMANIPKIGILT